MDPGLTGTHATDAVLRAESTACAVNREPAHRPAEPAGIGPGQP